MKCKETSKREAVELLEGRGYELVEYDQRLKYKGFVEMIKLNDDYAILYRLTGKSWSTFKLVELKLMKRFDRLCDVRNRLNDKKSNYNYLQRETIERQFQPRFMRVMDSINAEIS